MTRRLRPPSALLGAVVLIAIAVPAASAATAPARTTTTTATAAARHAALAPARSPVGTVKGRISAAHHLKTVDLVLYERKTAQDGSKGWVETDYIFATGGYGLALNKKTGAYSFKVHAGRYRLEFNGAYGSGHQWGIVGYGPRKPAAAAFGKTVVVRKGKDTKRINVKTAGNFGTLKLPDPQPSLSPSEPTAGGNVSVVLGARPHGTAWTYTWQIGNSRKYLSFKRTVTVPSSAAGKTLGVVVYAHAYGKNGASVAMSTGVGK